MSLFSFWQSINLSKNFPVVASWLPFKRRWRGDRRSSFPRTFHLPPPPLIVMPSGNGFSFFSRRRTLCPSEESNKFVRLFEQRLSYPSSVWILSEHWDSVGVFTLSILPLPVKQTFEGFCVACLYFTISKRCLLTGDLNYNHLDIRQAPAWNNAARLLRTEHQ